MPRSSPSDTAAANKKAAAGDRAAKSAKGDTSAQADKVAKTPRADNDKKAAAGDKKRTRIRDMPARFIARTPWLRRRYAKRLIRTIERYKKKGRPLPDNLARLERHLRTIPEPKRAKTVEEMMETSAEQEQATPSRAMRRAVGRQDRQKGGKGGGVRPGTLPGQPRQRTR